VARGLKILFAGTPEFAAVSLEALLGSRHQVLVAYTQPDRPAGRGRKLTPSPVKTLAQACDLPVRQPVSLRDPVVQQELAQWQVDVMVVVAYGLILPEPVLLAPRLGCLNVHASLLPRWRGAAPIQRAILAGDTETGITLMQMDAGLDTGDMLHTASCPIAPGDTAQILHDRLARLGGQALLETLSDLAAGSLRPRPQDDGRATYAEKLQKAEARLNWRRPAVELAQQVWAFNPWPVAFTPLDAATGKNLRIWQARPLPRLTDASPGTVVAESREGVDVATAEGILRLQQLQLPGGKPLAAEPFLNAHSLLGKRLC
jgi:methionyl-tRNA formyltransferase